MAQNSEKRNRVLSKSARQAVRSLKFKRAAELRDELSRLKKLLPAGAKK